MKFTPTLSLRMCVALIGLVLVGCNTDAASKKDVAALEQKVNNLEARLIDTESLLMLTRANGWKRVPSQPGLETVLDCAAKGGDLRCVPMPELANALRALDCYTNVLVDAQSKEAKRGKLELREHCTDGGQKLRISPREAEQALTLLRQGRCFGKKIDRVAGAPDERPFTQVEEKLTAMRAVVDKSRRTRKLLEKPEIAEIVTRYEQVRPLFQGATLKGSVHELRCIQDERTLSVVLTEMTVKGKETLVVESLGTKEGW